MDSAGNLVPGLAKDDFTIYEDQTRQTIRSFETPEQHVLPPGVSINSTADLAKAPDAAEDLKADYASGNLSAAGQAQAAINSDISQLELLLAAGGVSLPTPSATPAAASPTPSP